MAASAGRIKAGQAYVEIALDSNKLMRGLKNAQKALRDFGAGMQAIGTKLVGLATVASAPLAIATKTFADFDDEMRMAASVSGATKKELESMTAVAEKLGRETSFTAKQVAEGMTAMGRMGFKPKEIEDSIASVLNLSRATGTDLATAAEIAANNMRVFGMNSSQMTQVADILTATANGSAQSLTDLAEGLKMAGPQAAAAKDNIINVSGALGVLANMGIKGSLAGTALRKAYSQFANTKIQAKLKAIGISTTDANGNLRAMPEIMADIAKHMNTLPSAARLNFAEEIFDLRGSLAGLQLGGNIQQLDEFIKKLRNVGGTAAQTAKEMDSGIGGALRKFMSAVEGCQLAIGRIIGEALTPYINKMSSVLNKVAEWIAAHKNIVIVTLKVIAVVAAVGAALIVAGLAFKAMALSLGVLITGFKILATVIMLPITAVKALIAVFNFLKVAMIALKAVALATWAVISSPAFVIGAALTALVAIVWKLTGAWDACANALKGVFGDFSAAFGKIKSIVGETFQYIKMAFESDNLAGAAKMGLAALQLAWLEGIYPIKKAWFDLKNFIADTWTVVVYSLLKLGNNLWYGLLLGMQTVGYSIADAWDVIWNGVIGVFEKTIAELKKAWVRFKGVFDKSINVKAEVAKIDKETEEKKNARSQKTSHEAEKRKERRDATKAAWAKSNKSYDDAQNKEINDNRKKRDSELQKHQDDIDKARKNYESAKQDITKVKNLSDAVKRINGLFNNAEDNYQSKLGFDQAATTDYVQLEEMQKKNPNKANQLISDAIKQFQEDAKNAETDFQNAMKDAVKDGVIDQNEDANLTAIAERRGRALSLEKMYSGLLQNVSTATATAIEKNQAVKEEMKSEGKADGKGTFSAFEAVYGNGRSTEQQIADNTDEMRKFTKRIYDYINTKKGLAFT